MGRKWPEDMNKVSGFRVQVLRPEDPNGRGFGKIRLGLDVPMSYTISWCAHGAFYNQFCVVTQHCAVHLV